MQNLNKVICITPLISFFFLAFSLKFLYESELFGL